MKGTVFITCPRCDGYGGRINPDGTQQICSICKNTGHIVKPLVDFEKDVRADERARCVEKYNEKDEVLSLFYGMTETMQKSILQIMVVTQKEPVKKNECIDI